VLLGASLALALALVLGSCSGGAVPVEPPDLDEADAAACADLVDALPETLAGESRRDVDPDGAPAAAWGDPAIVLTCGVAEPAAYDEFASCIEVDGTGWFTPEESLTDPGADLVVTELTHRPRVALRVPAEHRGQDSVLAGVAGPVREVLERDSRCR
jgi:hypothetical protein